MYNSVESELRLCGEVYYERRQMSVEDEHQTQSVEWLHETHKPVSRIGQDSMGVCEEVEIVTPKALC